MFILLFLFSNTSKLFFVHKFEHYTVIIDSEDIIQNEFLLGYNFAYTETNHRLHCPRSRVYLLSMELCLPDLQV